MPDHPQRERRCFRRTIEGRSVQVTAVTCAEGWRVRSVVVEGWGGIAPPQREAYDTAEVAATVGLWLARAMLSPAV